MSIYEVILLEELVDRVSYDGTHSEHCGKGVAPRTQMCDLTQELHAVTLLLERVIRFRARFDHDFFCLDFKRLLSIWRQDEVSRHLQCRRYRRFGNLFEVVEEFRFINHLYGLEERTVVQLDKSEFIGAAVGSDPALYYNFLICIFFAFPKKSF